MVRNMSVFPTHVGMDRKGGCLRPPYHSIPHARGDGPVGVETEVFDF